MNIYRYLANIFTIYRILIVIPILILLSNDYIDASFYLFLIAGISDLLDGILARKSKINSIWGEKYDPLADKLISSVVFIWLTTQAIIPFWSFSLLFIRDYLITDIRHHNAKGKSVSKIAKIKTTLQFVSILLFLCPLWLKDISIINSITSYAIEIYWVSFSLSIYTAISYLLVE